MSSEVATGIKSSECSLACEWQRTETTLLFSTYLMCNIIRFWICYFLTAISGMVLNVIAPCSWLLQPNIVLYAKKEILAIWIPKCRKFTKLLLHVYIHGILVKLLHTLQTPASNFHCLIILLLTVPRANFIFMIMINNAKQVI